jgi:hypothetical protein
MEIKPDLKTKNCQIALFYQNGKKYELHGKYFKSISNFFYEEILDRETPEKENTNFFQKIFEKKILLILIFVFSPCIVLINKIKFKIN